MAHYVSGRRLPYGLPPRLRGLGQSDFFTRATAPAPYADFAERETRRTNFFTEQPRTRTSTRKVAKTRATKRKRKTLKHGDPIYCVFVKKKKIACSRVKANAEKIAKREKIKRAKGVRIRKMKYELRCPPGTKLKCKERVRGSRKCKRKGCGK